MVEQIIRIDAHLEPGVLKLATQKEPLKCSPGTAPIAVLHGARLDPVIH
jgi:hypothetical protein